MLPKSKENLRSGVVINMIGGTIKHNIGDQARTLCIGCEEQYWKQ